MPELCEGDRINNYLLEARLGAGTFGEVWRAHHHVFNDVVAVKVPTDAQYVRNLQREGVAIHGLRHPNIVRAIDLDPYADPPYLIMEYVDGPSLREVIDEHGRRFPIQAAVTILRGILQALTAAHASGLIHRDLKPANILLKGPIDNVAALSEQAVKVTDFGLGHVGGVTTQSIMQSGSRLTEDGRSVAGTYAYMSPEQKSGEALDSSSDLYPCGIMLFEMLTGDRPQGNELPRSLRPEAPDYLDEVFRRSYARRDRRFNSAQEMLAALNASSSRAVPPPPPARAVDATGPRCPSCGQPVERTDQFCIRCGHQLVESIPRCHACQAYVQAGDKFCILCGSDLRVSGR